MSLPLPPRGGKGKPPAHKGLPPALTPAQVQAVTALVGLFGTGAIGTGMIVSVAEILVGLGISWSVARWVAGLVCSNPGPVFSPQWLPPGGAALAQERESASAWLAVYTVRAAERVQAAVDSGVDGAEAEAEGREYGYLELQQAAEERRLRAAALVDVTGLLLSDRATVNAEEGPLLGWYAVVDERTTPECRWANRKNFRADRQPSIGWPGAVHLFCRCVAGPPVPGAPTIPAA